MCNNYYVSIMISENEKNCIIFCNKYSQEKLLRWTCKALLFSLFILGLNVYTHCIKLLNNVYFLHKWGSFK